MLENGVQTPSKYRAWFTKHTGQVIIYLCIIFADVLFVQTDIIGLDDLINKTLHIREAAKNIFLMAVPLEGGGGGGKKPAVKKKKKKFGTVFN